MIDFIDVVLGKGDNNLPAQARLLNKVDKAIGIENIAEIQKFLDSGGLLTQVQRVLAQPDGPPRPPPSPPVGTSLSK